MYKMSTIGPLELRRAVFRLPLQSRIKFLEMLENDLFPARLRGIIAVLRSKAKTSSLKKVTQITRKVRKKLYEEENKGRR